MRVIGQAAATIRVLKRGLVYKGERSASELISGSALATLSGVNVGTAQNNTSGWLEFVKDGVTRYVARRPYRNSISWNQLNARDLITGNKVVTIGGKQYRVRLLTGGNGNPSSATGGEWNELIYAVCSDRPANYDGPVLANLTAASMFIGSNGNIYSTLCQETQASTSANCIRRGRDNATYYAGLSKTDAGTTVYWRPVLELIG